MNRVILYHARLPGWLAPADAAGLTERIPYAKRVGLAARRADREASLAGIALALAAVSALRGRVLAPETLRFAPGEKPVFATRDAIGVDVESGHSSGLSAALRGHTLRLLALRLPDGAEGWLATDFEPTSVERGMLDPLAELRRHAA